LVLFFKKERLSLLPSRAKPQPCTDGRFAAAESISALAMPHLLKVGRVIGGIDIWRSLLQVQRGLQFDRLGGPHIAVFGNEWLRRNFWHTAHPRLVFEMAGRGADIALLATANWG
jgi:hypothetical protein